MCGHPRLAEQKLNTKLDKFPQKIRLKLRQLRVMKALIKAEKNVWICTARNMKKADFDFLAFHGLNAKIILSRKEGDFRNDQDLKTAKLKRLFNLKQFQGMEKIMFDDNKIIRKELQKIGIKTLHQDQLRLK